jgi:hypothetical protein
MSPAPLAWRVLSEEWLLQGQGREAHRTALQGLSVVGANRDLWRLVSESYVARGDYEAAIRAKWASFSAADGGSGDWRRMAELMVAAGRTEEARGASQRVDALAGKEANASESRTPALGRRP